MLNKQVSVFLIMSKEVIDLKKLEENYGLEIDYNEGLFNMKMDAIFEMDDDEDLGGFYSHYQEELNNKKDEFEMDEGFSGKKIYEEGRYYNGVI